MKKSRKTELLKYYRPMGPVMHPTTTGGGLVSDPYNSAEGQKWEMQRLLCPIVELLIEVIERLEKMEAKSKTV